ncbi:hypothetical protein [Micromonospora craniellae]|nr:hypothetical protein [Micromonospora craniellae]QOC92028.1 hypothetical protein ID554_29900 [Micromonospora craniellae]
MINKFLNLVNIKPIDPSGKWGPPPYRTHSAEEIIPPGTKLCGTPKPSAD